VLASQSAGSEPTQPSRGQYVRTFRAGLALLVLSLVLPSSKLVMFDGLPFSSPVEFLLLLSLAPLAFSKRLRLATLDQLRLYSIARYVFLLGPSIAAALKLAILVSNTTSGFEACYSSLAVAPSGPCEYSYEEPFSRGRFTRFDKTIDFGPTAWNTGLLVYPAHATGALEGGVAETNWNLSFQNSNRFNLYNVPDDRLTEKLPIAVRWNGVIDNIRPGALEVTYLGEGTVRLGERVFPLSPSYESLARVLIPVRTGRTPLRVDYRFDTRFGDPYRGQQLQLERGLKPDVSAFKPYTGPYAQFHLRMTASPERRSGGGFITNSSPTLPRLVALGSDLLVLAACTLLIGAMYSAMRIPARFTLAATAVATATYFAPRIGGLPLHWATDVAVVALLVVLGRSRFSFPAEIAWWQLLVLNLLRSLRDYPWLFAVIYRRPGSDWLTTESYARAILESGSLEAGDKIFHYQPGFRYVVFLSHFLFGDNDVAIGIAIATLLSWTAVWSFLHIFKSSRLRRLPAAVATSTVGLALLLLNSQLLTSASKLGLSETPTWILLPLLVPMYFYSRSPVAWIGATVAGGLSLLIRTNQAPGFAFLFLLFLLSRQPGKRRYAFVCALLLVFLCLLPGLHNWIFGHRFILLPETTTDPTVISYPVKTIPEMFTSSAGRRALLDQLGRVFYLSSSEPRSPALRPVFGGLLVVWLFSGGWMVAKWHLLPWWTRALWIWPLAYLLPFLSANPSNFYPRHIVVGFLAMASSVVAICERGGHLTSPALATDAPPVGWTRNATMAEDQ
jgi:hypothetical protein